MEPYAKFYEMGYLVINEKEEPFGFVIGNRNDIENLCAYWDGTFGKKFHISGHSTPCYIVTEE